ncbi:actinodin3 [Erpetoichthys calabaricus]|uniref:actinodin3 n=1 Tax=Erpetoichthys calabaricus TaxID=27687 RepID=UPI0010A0B9E5|nr:actinodin3 [Erpetoichthys calabaricus]
MISWILPIGALLSCTFLPGQLDATSLMKILKPETAPSAENDGIKIGAEQAHSFLSTHSRPKRNADKWHRNVPDFQAYYRYYNSIGHYEGVYEIDRLRMLYQQMRHLEQVHGPNAPYYQYTLGMAPTKCDPRDKKCKPVATNPTNPPPVPTTPTPPAPIRQANIQYLCNPKDPGCQPYIVYIGTGTTPYPCDPRYDPACSAPTAKKVEAPAPPPASKAKSPMPQPPPAPQKGYKAMEYDCDPYWDPDCPRPLPLILTKGKTQPPPPPPPPVDEDEEDAAEEEEEDPESTPPSVPEPLKKIKKPPPPAKAPFNIHGRYYNFDPYDPYAYGGQYGPNRQ